MILPSRNACPMALPLDYKNGCSARGVHRAWQRARFPLLPRQMGSLDETMAAPSYLRRGGRDAGWRDWEGSRERSESVTVLDPPLIEQTEQSRHAEKQPKGCTDY